MAEQRPILGADKAQCSQLAAGETRNFQRTGGPCPLAQVVLPVAHLNRRLASASDACDNFHVKESFVLCSCLVHQEAANAFVTQQPKSLSAFSNQTHVAGLHRRQRARCGAKPPASDRVGLLARDFCRRKGSTDARPCVESLFWAGQGALTGRLSLSPVGKLAKTPPLPMSLSP